MPTLKNVPANSSENTGEGDSFFDAFRDMVRPFAQTLAEDTAFARPPVNVPTHHSSQAARCCRRIPACLSPER
jgi:hypothetical protein